MLNLVEQHDCSPHAPQWKLASADWKQFREWTYLMWDFINDFSIDDSVGYFTAFIINTTDECIPQTNGRLCKRLVPWWNDECRRHERNKIKRAAYSLDCQLQEIS